MANKKIKNATTTKFAGITFKSALEVRIYKALKTEGIDAEYEKHTYTLSPKVVSTKPFYNRTPTKGFHRIQGTIQAITYTPDFTFKLNDVFVILEVKGFENDVFPIKRNLFRKYLEKVKYPVMYFEIRTKKELMEALKAVKNYVP